MQENWQVLLKQQVINQYVHNLQEWADLNISTSGLLNLTIVSNNFANLSIPQRKEQIHNLLKSQVPHLSPGFISLYTPQEADSLNLPAPQVFNPASIQTWQDLAIQAANPQNQSQHIQREPQIPRTITFYSFKGGVGRTTALTHVASILAMRGRKVVAVDLDLEAPGLSTAFNLKPQPKYGIVDYFYERSYLPEGVEPSISIAEIFGEVKIPNATGRLFVVPAGSLNLDYVSKVDDLHANTIIDGYQSLWSVFKQEIYEQLKPDILLIDSRTGINQWGALSLIQAADEAIIFLFPNEQNKQGIEVLLQSLQSLSNLSINFVFSPVFDSNNKAVVSKINDIWKSLLNKINAEINKNSETDEDKLDFDNYQTSKEKPLIIPYFTPIAFADSYPVASFLDYYNQIANWIDEETEEIERRNILINSEKRWAIIESLQFSEVNAADTQQKWGLLFQRTTDFEKFLDDTTCLIRGRKGTGKTALYWLFLQHKNVAQKLARGRLDNTRFLSAHGRFQNSRLSRDEFQIIDQNLQQNSGTWESFWRAYLLVRCYQENLLTFPKGKKGTKFSELKKILNNLPTEKWQSEYTQALLLLSTNSELRLLVKDAIDIINELLKNNDQKLWVLYDDLDEDFREVGGVRQHALTGLFQLVQSCDAKRLTEIRFKIFLREDIWNRLIFDNRSHFNGRDIILQWTRVDFLRLALRQVIQSESFKDLVDRFSPVAVESIDQASEEVLDKALELLWGSRRRKGDKAKYVSRWVYERLTDSSGTTFPRSLSILLEGAKEHELTYRGKSSIQPPTDRLLRSKSLESGLQKASEKRCKEIKEEYPDLIKFFDSLKNVSAFLPKEQLQEVWRESAHDIADFEEFVSFLSEIGIIEWRETRKCYKVADIYVYGFEMIRQGAM